MAEGEKRRPFSNRVVPGGEHAALNAAISSRLDEAKEALPVGPIPAQEKLDELRRAFVGKVWDLLHERRHLAALSQLLRTRELRTRTEAWKFVMNYLIPIPGSEEEGGRSVQINFLSHVPRPEKVIETTATPGPGEP